MRAGARTQASIKYGVSVEVYIRVEVKCKVFLTNGDNETDEKKSNECVWRAAIGAKTNKADSSYSASATGPSSLCGGISIFAPSAFVTCSWACALKRFNSSHLLCSPLMEICISGEPQLYSQTDSCIHTYSWTFSRNDNNSNEQCTLPHAEYTTRGTQQKRIFIDLWIGERTLTKRYQ